MKSVGIITEFNPFHNGHQYILNKAKEESGADCIICVMSGHFVQRGEGSIYDKWYRTEKALLGGADLIVELPTVFALQSAEGFARGGIFLLNALSADAVSFGIEEESSDHLFKTSAFLENPSQEYQTVFEDSLHRGLGYAAAQAEALKTVPFASSLTPNNILGLSYLSAAKKLGFHPQWVPIKRIGVFHDDVGSGSYSSASHIRTLLKEEKDACSFLPYTQKKATLNQSLLETLALANLRTFSSSRLKEISGVSEGLENRILSASMEKDFEVFLQSSVSKRYTASRIRRITYCALLGISKELEMTSPTYIRILGMTEKGQQYLKEKKSAFSLPLITKTADAKMDSLLEKDILATNLWSMATGDASGMKDFYISPIIIKKGEHR